MTTTTKTKERKENTKTAKILPWAIAAVASVMLFTNAPSKTQTNAEVLIKDFTNQPTILAAEIRQEELTENQRGSLNDSSLIKGSIQNTDPLDDEAINYRDVLDKHPDFIVTASGGSMTKIVIEKNGHVIEHYKPVRGIRITNAELTDSQISNLNSSIKLALHGKSSDYIQTLESKKTVDENNVQTAYGAVLPLFQAVGINNPEFEVFE